VLAYLHNDISAIHNERVPKQSGMRRIMLGEMVLNHQRAFRLGLLLLLLLLLCSNGWFAYSRSLRLSNQQVHRIVSGINQHFSRISGFLETIQVEASLELQSKDQLQSVQGLLQALQDSPDGSYFALDALPAPFSHRLLGNLTGQGRAQFQGAEALHEMQTALGLAPLFEVAYHNLGANGVAWVYYVSRHHFIYLYPYVSSASYHYSVETEHGVFWTLAQPAVNPKGLPIITPVYMDQAGQGEMLTMSRPVYAAGHFCGVLSMDVTVATLRKLLQPGETTNGTLYLLNADHQILVSSEQDALPQENLLRLPVTPSYLIGPTAHVMVLPIGNTGLKLLQYLPNRVLLLEIVKGTAPALIAALLLWLALILLTRTWMLNRELRRLSEHDALTGALNHRAFQSLLSQLYARYREQGELFALVMVDLDHFKKINDSYGHAVGDEVLKVLVRLARRMLRNQDHIARLGGEEFVLVLPATELREAMKAAVRLRLQLERLNWSRLGLARAVTASMGCAVVLPSDASKGAVLKRADDAMYRAKQEGRNRVCADLPPVQD